MNFGLTFEQDYARIMSAVINDSRNMIPDIAGMDGVAIYAYAQGQISLVIPGVLVYRIVGDGGVLCGFVGINSAGTVVFQQLRPAFMQFAGQISDFIRNFISSNLFRNDYLV